MLNLEKKGNVEFTAEIYQMIDYYSSNQELEGKNYNSSQGNGVVKDQNLNSERHNLDLQGLMTGRMENRATPVFTSAPITLRQDNITFSGTTSQNIRIILSKIEQLDSNIKTIKRDILQQMECRLDELKSSVVTMMEQIISKKTYADVTKDSSGLQSVDQSSVGHPHSVSDSSIVDEGYGDQSTSNVRSSSSQTRFKTVFVPDMIPSQRKPDQSRRITTTPQPVPVHITNRNQAQHNIGEKTDPNRSFLTSRSTRKTLIVGDSILKKINPKGLENGVRICKKNGAKIKDIWNEVAVYDLKSFQNIIVCVGGNDSSSGTETRMFEKKYDELVGGIRTANNDCTIYLCKVVPRGDVDITGMNASVENVANHWRMQQVKDSCFDQRDVLWA